VDGALALSYVVWPSEAMLEAEQECGVQAESARESN
jgi:hypothetical protein